MTADELDPKAIAVGTGHGTHPTSEDLTAIAADLLAPGSGQLRGWNTLAPEVAVHVRCGSVPRLAGVDDDNGSALAPQLEGGGKSSGGPADDGDVAVPLDGMGGMVAHDT